MGLGAQKGCIYSYKHNRYKYKDDLSLYFCLALTFLAPVVPYLSIERHGPGKSPRKQNNSCNIRAEEL